MEKLKVLVVEDVGSIQKIWDKILVDAVFEKSFADDGKEGLDLYKSSSPDIILLDIQMPEMTGYSVLKEIRQGMGDTSTAVVMQTTVSQKDDIMECVKLGIQGYIIKPFDEEDALKKVFKAYEGVQPEKVKAAREVLEKIGGAEHLETPLSTGAPSHESITPEEQEYLEEIRFCLETGDISDGERRMLDRLRTKLNILEKRGAELEGQAKRS